MIKSSLGELYKWAVGTGPAHAHGNEANVKFEIRAHHF